VTFRDRVYEAIQSNPGLSDKELTEVILVPDRDQQPTNQACRDLTTRGKIIRVRREDGVLGNYPAEIATSSVPDHGPAPHAGDQTWLSEDQVKRAVTRWLLGEGWRIDTLNLGCNRGIDIIAIKNEQRWIIEAKGQGSRQAMRVNYFLNVLGETLQRLDDPSTKYSIALPDILQFRKLWTRLPELAKKRTGITALFVSSNGHLVHMK